MACSKILPANTSDKFDYLISWESFLEDHDWAKQWDVNSPRTYIMLRSDANPLLVSKKIEDFLKSYNKDLGPQFQIELCLQRFDEMYLHSDFKNGYINGGRIEICANLQSGSNCYLLIACINFMNLTTARSIKRAKEIGVRKVSGATRASIIGQFMSEAMLFVFLAVMISLLLTMLLLPAFNSIMGKTIELPITNKNFWFEFSVLTLLTGFISGCYPALFLSAFNPVKVLKGPLKFRSGTIFSAKGW
jgi:hypothetical protein